MNIKAQGLLNAAAWIQAEYGRDALGRVVRACSPALRERYVSAIAINWHPLEEFIEFLTVAERVLGAGGTSVAEQIGAAGARVNLATAGARVAIYLSNPEFLMRRVMGLYSQFNDEGELVLLEMNPRIIQLELRKVRKPEPLFCATLTGWASEMTVTLTGRPAIVRHVNCRGRGGTRCMWEARWETDLLPGEGPAPRKNTTPPRGG